MQQEMARSIPSDVHDRELMVRKKGKGEEVTVGCQFWATMNLIHVITLSSLDTPTLSSHPTTATAAETF